jgi:hypothetical protein
MSHSLAAHTYDQRVAASAPDLPSVLAQLESAGPLLGAPVFKPGGYA